MIAKTTEMALRLENVGREFGANAAVRNLSLTVRRGEIVALVGHSGCGKSTLLRIIAGVEKIDAGHVLINEREVGGPNFVEPELRSVGMVFQDYALFPHLSVYANILFGLKKRPRRVAAEMAADVIRLVGIADLVDRFPHALSGGEQQRVALARALAPQPDIVLMDEPFSNLDQGLRERVRNDTLSLLRSLGATVIIVTHDPQEALSSGDRVVLMRSGEVVQSGLPVDLYQRPQSGYVAEFFCGCTRISGRYDRDHVDTALGRFVHPNSGQTGRSCIVYIRPNAIRVSPEHGEIAASIVERVFLGDRERLILQVDGVEAPLTAEVSEPLRSDIRMIRMTIIPEKIFVF